MEKSLTELIECVSIFGNSYSMAASRAGSYKNFLSCNPEENAPRPVYPMQGPQPFKRDLTPYIHLN
ncbi:MAG: hypothetical protein M1348_02615 [Candidatus Parvarchaeota archaeon]|nr:hypothetical protein [Candidatus Parvarchaeota archaeon]